MTVMAFDTLDFATKLKNAGMQSGLAEVQSEEMARILQNLASDQMASKNDLVALKIEIYGFIVKATSFTVGLLGGLQVLFHFVK